MPHALARSELADTIRTAAVPLASLAHVDAIVAAAHHANTVLLGEATHGTHEFYALRAHISARLIEEHGFDAVAVEADWPDALRVSRWLRGDADLADADAALGGFERFPRWMWRNAETRDFIAWLRAHDDTRAPDAKVGFFGLDLYSLHASIAAVVDFLDRRDPELALHARQRYGCFDGLADDPQRYGFQVLQGRMADCEHEVVTQLRTLMAQASRGMAHDGSDAARDELFYAQQNARVVQRAEQYYRTMVRGGAHAWNLRDTHMADTLAALHEHLTLRRGRPARLIVWAHNSHVGDARATEMGEQHGQLTLGQLVREHCEGAPGEAFTIGFTTHTGSVAAAHDWGEPVQRMAVRPSHEDSIEHALHEAQLPLGFVPLHGALRRPLGARRLERAIGVVYRPATERWSHYFDARVAHQFDALVHVDRSRALTPLDAGTGWDGGEPETWPSGL